MQGPFVYAHRHKYPHLSEAEATIWHRFITKYPDYFDQCWYDVELGLPRGYDPERPAEYQKHHLYLGGYKIDVLGQKGDRLCIVEVKKQATTKALGEIWAYEFLYLKEHPEVKEVDLLILTDEEMPHMREICDPDEVKLIVV